MCTLIAFHRCFADAPLVVAANRDEFHERPTEGPALRNASISSPHRQDRSARGGASARSTRVVAPRDLRAGGSWLGVSSTGLFAAITNRRCDAPDPKRRSRGLLVMEALAEPSAERAWLRGQVAELAAGDPPDAGALAGVCRTHVAGSPLDSTCVHAGAYGTRSSTLLWLGARPALRYADGPPCEAAYRDLTPLLHDLGLLPARERVSA